MAFGHSAFQQQDSIAGLKSLPGTARVFADSRYCSRNPATMLPAVPGVYADLVTVAGFKPVVASEKAPGGFDSLPLPLFFVSEFTPVAEIRTVVVEAFRKA